MNVSDKLDIVTGGGRRINIVLARNRADVVVDDVNLDDAQSVATEISDMGRRSMAQRADVTVQKAIGNMVQAVLDRFSRIAIPVNAGVAGASGWGEREAPRRRTGTSCMP